MHAGKPIYWHEGLFLRPQHFQQLDEYCNNVIQSRFQLGEPYQWGVKSINILQGSVANEIVEITSLDLLFKDGTHVQFPGNAKIERRSIANMWDNTGKPLSLYLGIKNSEIGKNNVKLESHSGEETMQNMDSGANVNTGSTRYFLAEQGVDVADRYADDKYHRLLFLDYQIRMFVGSEINTATDYHVIKIAELVKISGDVHVSAEYIPPLINISSSNYMVALLRDNLEQINSIARKLSKQSRSHLVQNVSQNSSAVTSLLILQTLNRYLPLLQQLLICPSARPYDLYLHLRQLISELSTFSHSANLYDTVKTEVDHALSYRHDSLYSVFKEIGQTLSLLFRELISVPEHVLPLKYDGTYYAARIS